MLIKLTKIVD